VRNVAYLVAIVLAIGIASHFAFQVERAGQLSFVLGMMVPTAILAALAAVRAYRDGVLRGWLAVRSGDFTRGFVSAAVLFGAAWAFTRVVTPVGTDRESWLARLYLQLGDPTMLRRSVAVVVLVIVVLAVAEELVWRGLVVSLLEEKIGSRRAWVWAAVLYAVAHTPTIWALSDPVAGWNPIVLVAALAGGLVWGGMARRLERLWPSIFSHILFNWTVLMMFRLWGQSV
jgi:uncharacterized protein